MAPLQETYKGSVEIPYDGSPMQEEQLNMERVVISGMSGLFPECENIKDFTSVLYNKINPVISENSRWTVEHPELPKYQGIIPNVEKFDAQFFKVHYHLSSNMDSMARKLLEQTYQAIYDAGINPKQLWNKKVGVFIGTSSFSETEKDSLFGFKAASGFGMPGCSKAMFANRISYWLNTSGPSISIDALCSSSMVALQRAYNAINSGECESAIVGGTSICHHFETVVHCGRVIPLCMDGKTRSFDKNANGCARSEAISVLFLQKAKDAKRIYADVCYINSHYGPMSNELGPVFGPYRDEETLTNFLREFYTKAGIQPGVVEFVEAFGTAASEADRCELQALSNVLCKERKSPLLVGTVISNIGYTEAASGICSVIKVLLGYHTGQLAGNLHCDNPRDDVEALREGRMRIVTEHQRFNRSYAAVNSMSLGGLSLHLLLKGQNKHKDLSQFHSCIPYLVNVSGRQETGVQKILDELKGSPLDPEQIGLLHNIHEESISGHLSRGFVLLEKINDKETKCIKECTDYFDDIIRPLWFVYSGMGSQWVCMGQHLMQIPVFAAAIERCQNVLEPKGIDIIRIITCPKSTLDNILHCFVGICAVQIGLTDVLHELGIVPEKIIGHSVGELVCAYADGCFTAEETILAAYSRGLVSLQIPFIHGSMAAIGLGYKQIVSICPPEIEVACHNSAESCTISGPSEVMREFVAKLTAQGIFAKEVPCSNIAYHSRYIKEAGPVLLECLKDVIKSPKLRSEKWLSTSVPQDKWDEAAAKFSSAEYHTNNLLNPVLFEETSKLIPSNAVLIEVAPHSLLQAILNRSLPASCIYLPLTRRGHPDNALFMLEAIGKLYMQGFNPKIKKLYQKIDFPVSLGTPHLAHLVEWVHEEKWRTPENIRNIKKTAAAANFVISLYNDEHKYLKGFHQGNETLYPFSGALVCVWDTLAMSLGAKRRNVSVQFNDIHLHQQPCLMQEEPLRLSVQVQRGDGYFEVKSKDTNFISGYVLRKEDRRTNKLTVDDQDSKGRMLSSEDIYKIFHSRSSQYSGEFRSIKGLNEEMTRAKISWTGNWVTLLDSMLQLNALRRDYEGITVPRFIRRLSINIGDHKTYSNMNGALFNVHFDELHGVSRCAGVTMKDLRFSNLPPLPLKPLALKSLKFIPFFLHSKLLKTAEALHVFLQIISENLDKNIINIVELQNCDNYTIRKEIEEITMLELTININTINLDTITSKDEETLRTADLLVVTNMLINDHVCDVLCGTAPPDIFMLSTQISETVSIPQAICRAVASAATPLGRLVLSRWRPAPIPIVSDTISVNDINDLVLLASTKQNLTADKRLIIISSYPPPNGLKEMVKGWRKESNHIKIYVAMIKHTNEGIKKDAVEKLPDFDLTFNTYDDNAWGGHYFVSKDKFYLKAIEGIALLKNTVPGDLNTLHWEEATEPDSIQVKVTVYYAGLNGRDAKRVSGTVPYKVDDESDLGYGMDYSGLTDSGERVMGVIRGGAASSRLAAEPLLLWPVPAQWTLEEAATVPLPYAHAFYCLGIKSHLQPRTRLLVHGATGALGLAVISIALAYNCIVFATVSDMKKKHFLRKMFPSLPDDYIGCSRNDAFCDMILDKTRGAGCDFVISCLDGNLKDGSMKCLSDSGIALDTHQLQSKDNYQFGMFHLTRARHYIPVDFASIFKTMNSNEMRDIQLMMCEGIKRGYVRPLPRVTFEPLDVQHAFQLLAARCHRGRVLLNLHDKILPVTPRLSISSKGSHLIISATSNDVFIGKIVDVLIERGAKNILINHDTKLSNGYIDIQIKKWEKHGEQVNLNNINLVDEKCVELVVKACNNLAPIESVYFINTETADDKKKVTNFQINNLDIITRKQCPNIRCFAVVNEESNVGQDICINRAIDNLPSTMLNLPKLTKFGDESFKVSQGLPYNTAVDAMEQAIRSSSPVVLAHAMPLKTPTNQLLDRISTLAGINIQDRLSNKTTIIKSGQTSRFNNFDTQATKSNQTAVGLNVLFNYVDEDVLLATKDLIFMPTAINSSAEPDDILEKEATFLILVPGFNGHYNDFFLLCEQLKLPAIVLQPGLDYPNETVTEMAARLTKVLIDKIKPKKDFYLLGYSFGVQIALEMAAILEDQGLEGVVFCVDASPDTFPAALDSWLCEAGATDEVRLQDAIVQHMYGLMTGGESLRLQLELHKANTWPIKVEAGVRALRSHITHSSQYARALIETTYSRIKQARQYDAQRLRAHPLRSLLVVLRSSCQPASIEPDLGLSRYSVRAPVVYNLSAHHAHALEDLRCANIVNKHLGKNIVDTFENRNLCETYYLKKNE